MTDYWTGYSHGQTTAQRNAQPSVGILVLLLAAAGVAAAAALALVAVGIAILVVCFVVLYPTAAFLVVVDVGLTAWCFSAVTRLFWHDPAPFFLFGSHWLYLNWTGSGLAIILGIGVACIATLRVEFLLHTNPIYFFLRHIWRVGFPVALLFEALSLTRATTGLSSSAIWLIPICLGIILHAAFWFRLISLHSVWNKEMAKRQ